MVGERAPQKTALSAAMVPVGRRRRICICCVRLHTLATACEAGREAGSGWEMTNNWGAMSASGRSERAVGLGSAHHACPKLNTSNARCAGYAAPQVIECSLNHTR